MAQKEQTKARARLAELREMRNQGAGSEKDAGEAGSGDQKGGQLLKLLAQRRQRGGQGGNGEGRERLRKAISGGERDLDSFPMLKRVLQNRGDGPSGASESSDEGLSDDAREKLRERLESRKQKLEERLAKLDEAEAAVKPRSGKRAAAAKRSSASVKARSKAKSSSAEAKA